MGRFGAIALLATMSGCTSTYSGASTESSSSDAGAPATLPSTPTSTTPDGSAPSQDAGDAPPRVVQFGTGHAKTGSVPVTLPGAVVGSGIVVVAVANEDQSTGSVASVTDSANDAFVSANQKSIDPAANDSNEIWYGRVSVGVTTITVNMSNAIEIEVWALELSGVKTLDTGAITSSGPSSKTVTAPTVTPSVPRAIVISTASTDSQISGVVSGNPFTALPVLVGENTAWAVTSQSGPVGAVWSSSETGTFNATTVAFR